MSTRAAGLLLHPTSLPGRFGVGDLGPEADRFLDWVVKAGQSWWQVLPLGPPDGGSPYNCLSAFAGNPLLISPELLHRQGLLERADLDGAPDFPADRVDFEAVQTWKGPLLRRAFEHFERHATAERCADFESFCDAPDHRPWLDDWALFAALRRRQEGRGWWTWEPDLARREPRALGAARHEHREEIAFHRFVQWQLFEQWDRLHHQARQHGVRILGDLPIYVAWNSAEVWAAPHLFELDDKGHPLAVAGVPPDDYAATGQRWGNPLYRWDRLAEDGYAWWIARLRAVLKTCDKARLDHFRGFAGYWRIPAAEPTAEHGTWVDGPGIAFFDALRQALGDLPLIAEDLGVITLDVEALRRAAGLPGMKVLQFAFGELDSDHLPHRFDRSSVVYTGTHDNDTTAGWYRGLDRASKRRLKRYAGASARNLPEALIRLAYTSVADLAIVPVQDVLGLGSEARMNTPGLADGNWGWRLRREQLDARQAERLRSLVEISGRLPAGHGAKG